MPTTFSFNTGIPDANNNPSADQPLMKINNASTYSILQVDHVTFGSAPALPAASSDGQHLQVTFNGKHVPAAQTDPLSVLYTDSGTASTNSDLRFTNQSGTFPVSALRAFAYVAGATGTVLGSQSFNVATITRVSAGKFTVALTANAVSGTNFIVMVNHALPNTAPVGTTITNSGYTITGAGTFELNFINALSAFFDPVTFTFQVLQV